MEHVTTGVVVFGSPPAVGHVRPLIPVAKRMVARGFTVLWAISGDDNEPASKWKQPLADIGVTLIDLDGAVRFTRGHEAEFASTSMTSVFRRIPGRANDVGATAAEVIAAAIAGRPVVAAVYDYFALWFYVAMRRLEVEQVNVVVSAFPSVLEGLPRSVFIDDPVYLRELAQLRASGCGGFDETPHHGVVPCDPRLRVLCFSSPYLCHDAPRYVTLLGVLRDALPEAGDVGAAPAEHRELARRLAQARANGTPVFLLSMGTVVVRLALRIGGPPLAFVRRLFSTLARAALERGAVVVVSTADATHAELGIDEETLGPVSRDRLIAMPFVPQPLLFAHGLVDVMLMHGGANTFYEAVVSGVPLMVSPMFGDQEFVAQAVERLGVGVCLESVMNPTLPGARPLEDAARDVLPEMLSTAETRWKAAARKLADNVRAEDGAAAAEAILGAR